MEVINITTDEKFKDMLTSSRVFIKNYVDDTTLNDTPLSKAVILDDEMKTISKCAPTKDISEGNSCDQMLYIYTSGTTGLPKAAIMTQSR